MSLVRILALQVDDEASYARYSAEMAPLLTRHGGEFLWDFRVGATLRADCAYRAVRALWFEPAVFGWTVLARFEAGPKPDYAS